MEKSFAGGNRAGKGCLAWGRNGQRWEVCYCRAGKNNEARVIIFLCRDDL